MNFKKAHFLVFFVFTANFVQSQIQPAQLSLEQCIDAALLNNPEIKVAINEAGITSLAAKSARSERYAVVSAEASGGWNNRYESGNNYKNAYSKVGASQFLWQNQRVNSIIEQARYAEMASQEALEDRRQEIILLVKTAYFTCGQQLKFYRFDSLNVERSELFLGYAKERYTIGVGRKSDILKAESDLAEAEYEKNASLNAMNKSANDLAMLTGLAPGFPVEADSAVPSGTGFDFEFDSLLQLAYNQYPELRSLYKLDSAQQSKIREARAYFYPSLNFDAGYEWSYDPVLRGNNTWYTMFTLRWDLFNGFEKKYRYQTELIKKASLENQADQMRQYLVRELHNCLINLGEAKDQINLTKSLMKTTAENLETAKAQFQAGTGSMLELADARVSNLNAQKNHILAITSYKIAMANLERITGKTINHE